jgi:hypothetical protein
MHIQDPFSSHAKDEKQRKEKAIVNALQRYFEGEK